MNKKAYDQKIWSEILSSGESISFDFSIGRKYLKFRAIIVGILCGLICVIPAIVAFAYGSVFSGLILLAIFGLALWQPLFYLPRANLYALTNKRVLVRKGWLSANTQSIDYHNITDVAINQDFLSKKFLGTGTILVNTAGHVTNQIILRDVENPFEIKRKIDALKAENK